MSLKRLQDRLRRLEGKKTGPCPSCESRERYEFDESKLTKDELALRNELRNRKRVQRTCSCGFNYTRADLSALKTSELKALQYLEEKGFEITEYLHEPDLLNETERTEYLDLDRRLATLDVLRVFRLDELKFKCRVRNPDWNWN